MVRGTVDDEAGEDKTFLPWELEDFLICVGGAWTGAGAV